MNELQKTIGTLPEFEAIFTDPKLRNMAKAWVAMSQLTGDLKTEIIDGRTVLTQVPSVPFWDDDSQMRAYLVSFPHMYDENGELLPENEQYAGLESLFEEDGTAISPFSAGIQKEQTDLQNAFVKYKQNEGTLNMEQWYHAVGGNPTGKVDESRVPEGIQPAAGVGEFEGVNLTGSAGDTKVNGTPLADMTQIDAENILATDEALNQLIKDGAIIQSTEIPTFLSTTQTEKWLNDNDFNFFSESFEDANQTIYVFDDKSKSPVVVVGSGANRRLVKIDSFTVKNDGSETSTTGIDLSTGELVLERNTRSA